MNIIRNIFPEKIDELKPLLRTAYRTIHQYQNLREEKLEVKMREAIRKTLPILVIFKEHIPAYKKKYIELLEKDEQMKPYDLIICFDRAIYELHTRVKRGQWSNLPWSQTLRDLLNERQDIEEISYAGMEETFLVSGQGASRGTTEGSARIVMNNKELIRVQKGDILITPMTDPKFTQVAQLISGLVTDRGGMVCHAAILAREFNLPCIVGCKNATQIIKDGQWIRLDALSGVVMGVPR